MEQYVSVLLTILKFLSIGLTAILSAIALLVEYKDENGKITYWGRRALIGIVVAAFVAASTTALEVIKGERESEKTAKEALVLAKRTSDILENINRSLHPLEGIEFSFWASVDLSSKQLEPYRERFSEELKDYLVQYESGNRRYEGMYASSSNQNGPVDVKVPLGAAAYPSEHKEELAFYLIRHTDFHLAFFKEPISPTYFEKKITDESEYKNPDLVINIDTSEQDQFGIGLEYNIENRTFEINGSSIQSDPRYWRTNGRIISMPDLKGSQMFVFTDSINVPSLDGDNSELVGLRGGIKIRTLLIDISGRQQFWFRTENLHEYKTPRGLSYFVFSLDNGIEEYAR
ncbi:hypothetical protein [Thalassomonas actiniarum]|uniref:Uncharacterized protein n=1 Tax=Thalassomonas actiniarum TaxID=485447 RepID=A0AAE9YUI3_9GAMM|nr:hypothetical protein [Thalassomonas actiniarum]WDE01480.1 hypothetical protein SG35_013205 [Thalassomonas actiniarum]